MVLSNLVPFLKKFMLYIVNSSCSLILCGDHGARNVKYRWNISCHFRNSRSWFLRGEDGFFSWIFDANIISVFYQCAFLEPFCDR